MLFLVVDDDELSRELFLALLAEEGDRVEAEASGSAALSLLSTMDPLPDAILTDIQMPGLTGNALALALREASPAGTLLFAMSGSPTAAAACKEFDGFLLKPFSLSDLQSMIGFMGSARSQASTRDLADPLLGVGQHLPQTEPAASSSAFESAPELEEDIYQKLSELMPSEPLGQMYALCIDDARSRIGVMRDLAAAGDDAGYRREAHAVKGGSGMIGATQLYKSATAAECHGLTDTGHGDGTFGVTATLDALSLACDRLERILVERTRN